MTEAQQRTASPGSSDRWIAVALVAAVLIAFGASVTYDFMVDDRWIIHGNESIRGWHSLIGVWTQPYWSMRDPGTTGLYRPLLMAIFAVLWNAGLRVPFWFHLLAVLAHLAATLFVWRLLRKLAPRWPAALAALYFAVHPVHIEAVASVVNSSEVFVTIATLALVYSVLRTDASTPSDRPISWANAVSAAVVYGAGLLIKESAVTAPALALLIVWTCQRPSTRVPESRRAALASAWKRWNRLFIACGATLALVVAARIAVLGATVSHGSIAAPGFGGLSTTERLWVMASLGPKIVELLLWPRILNPLYGASLVPGHTVPTIAAAVFVVLVALAVGLAVAFTKRGDRRVAAGLAWVVIAFLPASNLLLPTGQILAERTLYLPSVGIALVLAAVFAAVSTRLQHMQSATSIRVVLLGALTALVVVAANTTRRRSVAWSNHDAWFAQLVVANADDLRAHLARAVYLRSRGERADALAELERGYQLDRRDSLLLKEYAVQLLEQRQPVRAAKVTSELMSWRERRLDDDAVRLYLDATGAAYGADSVLSAADHLARESPTAAAWLYVGLASEALGNRPKAANAYAKGLELANGDSLANQFRVRLDAMTHAESRTDPSQR